MSNPAPTLPDTPQEAFGIPDNPLGRFPTLAGRNGSRRRSRGPGGGLPSNPLRGGAPHTPGTLSPSERRAQAKSRLQVVRPEAKSQPAKPAPGPGLTAHGAPTRTPREIPKTGAARDEREAIRHGMSKDTRRAHEGWSAETQDAFNKLNRATQDIDRREAGDVLTQHFKDLRERRVREAREARKPGPTPEQRAKRAEQYRKMRETLDNPGANPPNVVDEFPKGRHRLTVEEGDTYLKRARENDEQQTPGQ